MFTDADGRRFADAGGYEVHDRLRALLTYLPRTPNRPRLPDALDWGFHCARTRWIRGFMTFRRVWHARKVLLMVSA